MRRSLRISTRRGSDDDCNLGFHPGRDYVASLRIGMAAWTLTSNSYRYAPRLDRSAGSLDDGKTLQESERDAARRQRPKPPAFPGEPPGSARAFHLDEENLRSCLRASTGRCPSRMERGRLRGPHQAGTLDTVENGTYHGLSHARPDTRIHTPPGLEDCLLTGWQSLWAESSSQYTRLAMTRLDSWHSTCWHIGRAGRTCQPRGQSSSSAGSRWEFARRTSSVAQAQTRSTKPKPKAR